MNKQEIIDYLIEEIAAATKQPVEDINQDLNFLKLGISSIQTLKIINRIKKHLQVDISPVAMFEYKTIYDFAGYLNENLVAVAA